MAGFADVNRIVEARETRHKIGISNQLRRLFVKLDIR